MYSIFISTRTRSKIIIKKDWLGNGKIFCVKHYYHSNASELKSRELMDIQPVAVYHYTSQSSQQVYASGSVWRANCYTCGKTMIRRVPYKLMDASQTSV